MGDPKLPRRNWRKPKRPLNYDLKMEELKTLGIFGLRTKRELWKAHTELSRLRKQARALLALRTEERREKEPVLINALVRTGLVQSGSTLDDVLGLQVTDLLNRRLQTIIVRKLNFKTAYQARQAVTHRHISIGDRIIDIPSYLVTVEEEGRIGFTPGSPLREQLAAPATEDGKAAEAAAA
jgi:small subunit ribosomal protein S4